MDSVSMVRNTFIFKLIVNSFDFVLRFVLIAVRAEKSENDWVKWNPKGKYCEEQCYPGENAIIHCKISNLTNYENSHNVTLVLNLMFDNGYNESLVRKTAKFLKFGENGKRY